MLKATVHLDSGECYCLGHVHILILKMWRDLGSIGYVMVIMSPGHTCD